MVIIMTYLAKVPGIIVAVVLHEYIKALVSTRLGDPIPRQKGRLTLNPAKHIDPLGAIAMFIWGFGWGNPVQTSPIYYKDRKKGTIMTYVMPSVVNLFIGVAFGIVSRMLDKGLFAYASSAVDLNSQGVNTVSWLGSFISGIEGTSIVTLLIYFLVMAVKYIAVYNVATALFNIIPVYPLDGHKILNLFLPATAVIQLQENEKILQLILMFAIVLGFVGTVFNPFVYMIAGTV